MEAYRLTLHTTYGKLFWSWRHWTSSVRRPGLIDGRLPVTAKRVASVTASILRIHYGA